MSVHDDYAGGSYKSNGELETEVENLSSRVASLESDLEQLRELIRNAAEIGPLNPEFRGWEVFNVLETWANGEDES